MSDVKYAPACAVCTHEKRLEIDEKILSQKYTQKELSKEYGVSEQSISNHKNKHVLDSSMNVEKLQLMVQRALSKNLEPDNISEVLKLLEYNDKLEQRRNAVVGDCSHCELKEEDNLRKFRMKGGNSLGRMFDASGRERLPERIENELIQDMEKILDSCIMIVDEEYELFKLWIGTLPEKHPARVRYQKNVERRKNHIKLTKENYKEYISDTEVIEKNGWNL